MLTHCLCACNFHTESVRRKLAFVPVSKECPNHVGGTYPIQRGNCSCNSPVPFAEGLLITVTERGIVALSTMPFDGVQGIQQIFRLSALKFVQFHIG